MESVNPKKKGRKMKNMNCAYANTIDREHTGISASMYKRVPKLLSDLDILDLNDTLLCNGIHYLKVQDVEHGRQVLEACLSSLHYYHSIGCLTLFNTPDNMLVEDIFHDLSHSGSLDRPDVLADYFFDQFDYDFVWIELTASLSGLQWYQSFIKQLKASSIAQRMPIVKLTYEG